MRNLISWGVLCAIPTALLAQWQYVGSGLGNQAVKAMFSYADTLMVGTSDGIYRTEDLGASWSDISGDIGSRIIYDLRGGGAPRVLWVGTADGPWFTSDQQHYQDNTATGLTSPDVTYYWFGDDGNDEADWAVGTNGGGVFTGPELNGPWTAANNGLSGAGLLVRDLSGYSDEEIDYVALATDGGLFVSFDQMGSWQERNAGLDGASLHMRRLILLGSGILAATQGGLHLSMDQGGAWIPLVAGQRFSCVHYGPVTGVIAFGEGGVRSVDFQNWVPLDMGGVTGGDVTCMALTSSHIFVGTAVGGVFRRSLESLTSLEEPVRPTGHRLLPNHPNPFNPATHVPFQLAEPGEVDLAVFNLAGERVAVLARGLWPAGLHEPLWNVGEQASGIYLCRLVVDGQLVATRRLLLAR